MCLQPQQPQQHQAQHHDQQVTEYIAYDAAAARPADVNGVVLRHQDTKSNGQLSQPNRRSRLQAASATLESEELNSPGNLELWRNGVDHDQPQPSDNTVQNLPLNGDDSMHVEKETTC